MKAPILYEIGSEVTTMCRRVRVLIQSFLLGGTTGRHFNVLIEPWQIPCPRLGGVAAIYMVTS